MSDTVNPHQLQDEINAHNQAYFASQITQHARLKKLLPFLRPIDDLDANIRQIVETILSIEPKLGEDPFTLEDISEMMDSTGQLDEILLPSLFGRTPFPFRMLRHTLELHLVDHLRCATIPHTGAVVTVLREHTCGSSPRTFLNALLHHHVLR